MINVCVWYSNNFIHFYILCLNKIFFGSFKQNVKLFLGIVNMTQLYNTHKNIIYCTFCHAVPVCIPQYFTSINFLHFSGRWAARHLKYFWPLTSVRATTSASWWNHINTWGKQICTTAASFGFYQWLLFCHWWLLHKKQQKHFCFSNSEWIHFLYSCFLVFSVQSDNHSGCHIEFN